MQISHRSSRALALSTLSAVFAAHFTHAAPIEFDPTAPKFTCGDSASTATAAGTPVHLSGIDTTFGPQTILLKPLVDAVSAASEAADTTAIARRLQDANGTSANETSANETSSVSTTSTLDNVDVGSLTSSSRMCILSRWTKSLEQKEAGLGYYFPLGRSVATGSPAAGTNGTEAEVNNDWQRPPGKASRQVEYVCGTASNSGTEFSEGEYLCEVTLPQTSKMLGNGTLSEFDPPYYLTYYERQISIRNELSRFLQRTTFGPTNQELDSLESAYADIYSAMEAASGSAPSHVDVMEQLQNEWVQSQMDPSTFTNNDTPGQFTSLRRYWRRRLNPRTFETYRTGESGPHPCEANSRWRKFAFTNYDVVNSRVLGWGNHELGAGYYQVKEPHSVTVEKVVYSGDPTAAPSVSLAPSLTMAPSRVDNDVATSKPTLGSSASPSISSAPTATNIIAFGDNEDTRRNVVNSWKSRCGHEQVTSPVYSGSHSLSVNGGSGRCFLFRHIGPNCGRKMLDTLQAGDTIKISLMILVTKANQILEISTGHYHASKERRWGGAPDSSSVVARRIIPEADTWTKVEVVHTVGKDWTFGDQVLEPVSCWHYQLRFLVVGSPSFFLDNVSVGKVSGEVASRANAVPGGFLLNPDFYLDHKNWMMAYNAGFMSYDPSLNKNVMTLRRNKVLRQNIGMHVVVGQNYQFGLWAKLSGTQSLKFRALIRMRYRNKDMTTRCFKYYCNYYEYPITATITESDDWQWFQSEEFTMFDSSLSDWNVDNSFIIFQLITYNMPAGAELRVASFNSLEDASAAPSLSMVPSQAPSTLVVESTAYVLRYAGEVRTVVDKPFQILGTGEILPMDGASYTLCDVEEIEGDKMPHGYPDTLRFLINGKCVPIMGGNPTVNLDPRYVPLDGVNILDLSSNTDIVPINADQTLEGDWLLQAAVEDSVCSTFPDPYDNDYRGADPLNPDAIPNRFNPDKPVFAYLGADVGYALYDPRLLLFENTLENPLMDGGGNSVIRSTIRANKFVAGLGRGGSHFVSNDNNIALCVNDEPNFLNIDSCKISYEPNACIANDKSFVEVQLVMTFDDAALAGMFSATSAGSLTPRYIFAMSNLRYDGTISDGLVVDLPCMPGNPRSRWVPRSDLTEAECTNTLQDTSVAALKTALEASNDENPLLRDIVLWNSVEEDGCDIADYDSFGMFIMTSEGCFENVHPDHMSIYDMTKYVNEHLNHSADSTAITKFTDTGIMIYPDSHEMSQFEDMKELEVNFAPLVSYVTRYGDKMIVDDFAALTGLNTDPAVLTTIAQNMGTIIVDNKVQTNRGGGVLVCGSPDEVAPDPTLDDYFDVKHRDLACVGCLDAYGDYFTQKQNVWVVNMLEAEDQLCQRMAWALYEFVNVGTTVEDENSESNLYTYDVFTRHCFGNYFDIIKEMTYSPKMGEQFNFVDSTSTRFVWDAFGQLIYPDENFAREVMQLYTMGLHELEEDGTETRDEFGRLVQTYDNSDIMSNSRIFTGFTYASRRGNTEVLFRAYKSRMEPMRHDAVRHDYFPKISPGSSTVGWIGDRYPLCEDLPKHHFLNIGAKFVFRGGSSFSTLHFMKTVWDSNEAIKKFVLSTDSNLYQKLCNPDANGECNYLNVVELDENLPCTGKECRVDTLVIIQVAPGHFYEYVRQPCVNLAFFEGTKVVSGFGKWQENFGHQYSHSMCAHPKTAVASRICCGLGDDSATTGQYHHKAEYHGELVTALTNENQCAADGGNMCDPSSLWAPDEWFDTRVPFGRRNSNDNEFFWTNQACGQQIKVRPDGMVAVLHNPTRNPDVPLEETVPFVDAANAVTYIKLHWEINNITFEEMFPTVNNTCGNGACTATEDEHCLCSVTTSDAPAFDVLPSRSEILSSLHIGAFDPASYTDVTYSLLASSADVEAFSTSSVIGDLSTIFKVTNEFGEVAFFKNMISDVSIGGAYSMRNPVGFIDLVKPENRDVQFEIDAFLTHLVRYPSTAPFVAKKMIQYFGLSNPTPGYVSRVTTAFKTGSYSHKGATFGTGKYGDLKALAAAITLDPEVLVPVTDEDPVSGNVREPLLKVMHVMRSLTFERRQHMKFRHGLLIDLEEKVGQMVFRPPDQFSFFASDYAPPGVFYEAEMVSPESELLSMRAVVGITNGFFSLVNHGLGFYDRGFGPRIGPFTNVGDYGSSVGRLTYEVPSADAAMKIDDLSTLLTAGRLSDENKQVLLDAYNFFLPRHDEVVANRVLLHLVTSLPEFHTSNTIRKTGEERPVTPPVTPLSDPYKAIVYIDLSGGADSYNILTPYPGCYLYDEYFEARGGADGIGLTQEELLPIDGSSAEIDGCDSFGVISELSAYKDIFDEGKGIFLANMGHLHKPVNKNNWMTETRTDLFSHHTMKRESHVVDAFREAEGPGILGRMLDILQGYGHAVSATALDFHAAMVDGDPSTGRLADVMDKSGPGMMYERSFLSPYKNKYNIGNQDLRDFLSSINSQTSENSGVFADKWSQSFVDIWNKTDALTETLKDVTLKTNFRTAIPDKGLMNLQLKTVAELIAARESRGNGINRDVFYVKYGGYDSHSEAVYLLKNLLPSLSQAVGNFWAEMKAQGLQDQVTVIQGSEFGRTITSNSNRGSDHGWGGNYFMFGGDVVGGRILGEYPRSFKESDPTNIGRGRLIPTRPWDSLWYAMSQWFGIYDQQDLDWTLPNSQNFGCLLFTDYDIFESGMQPINGCGGPTHTTDISFQVTEPRYLTGEEQKNLCKLAVASMSKQLSFDPTETRCYIDDQVIAPVDDISGAAGRRLSSTLFEISGTAVINFDSTISAANVTTDDIESVAKIAAATASEFIVSGSIPQTDAPSLVPSAAPSTLTKSPTLSPSHLPSANPTPTTSAPSLSSAPTSGNMGFNLIPHSSADIGNVRSKGSSYQDRTGIWRIYGGGSDIWGSSDQFHYVSFPTSGDLTFEMLVNDFRGPDLWSKGGVMIRSSLERNSAHYSMFITHKRGLANQHRECDGCSSSHSRTATFNGDSVWLRVTKQGTSFSAAFKIVGTDTWKPFGVTKDIPTFSNNFYVGVAVTAHRSKRGLARLYGSNLGLTRQCTSPSVTEGQCVTSQNCEWSGVYSECFDVVNVPMSGSMPFTAEMVPLDGTDIGDVGAVGTSYQNDLGYWKIEASGSDIWTDVDSFHYLSFKTTGSLSVEILVRGLVATDPWMKGGIMFRDSLDPSSSYYAMFNTLNNGLAHQRRMCFGCQTNIYTNNIHTSSVWLRVTKEGNTFRAEYKLIGSDSWTYLHSIQDVEGFSGEFYVGIAMASHIRGQFASLYGSNFHVTDLSPPNECIGWRQTGGCIGHGPREPSLDRDCSASIDGLSSGYCLCSGSITEFGCGHEVLNCNDVCSNSVPSDVAVLVENVSTCPSGTVLTGAECASYGPTLTQGLSALASSPYIQSDWAGLPCGCFLWYNQYYLHDTNCGNAGTHPQAVSICKAVFT